jgi:D-lyxose ketol-isomerase
MKRSEINHQIQNSISFFNEMNFRLPPWAFWKPEEWSGKYETCSEIIDNMLGWDLTDFGTGDFKRFGLILFTIRNGNIRKDKKPYAEKIMIVDELQETPMHFHWSKMEDIINRGGGNLIMELYKSDNNEQFSNHDFSINIDGVEKHLSPGDKVILTPGESICLEQGIYHSFYGEKGKGKVLVGEVSAVNDDTTDNRFFLPLGRFPEIVEDEKPLHFLTCDYNRYI